MNTHPMIDTSRPWEQRMQQARRWTLCRLQMVKRMEHQQKVIDDIAREVIARKLPGCKLAEPTDYRAAYRRIIRRNLGRGKLP